MLNRRSLCGASALLGIASLAADATAEPEATRPNAEFGSRVAGALYGLAIGDGMGAPVEGWTASRIRARFRNHDFTTFLPPTREEFIGTNRGKGDGRITDDTLLLEALIRVYEAKQDHLDAYDYAERFVPEYAQRPVFIPERQAEMPALERPLWHAERYAHMQLALYNAEPRRAGFANRETQSYCSYVMPIGAVNAGDPRAAYDEAIAFGLATQTSYGLEAGGVAAASFAAALARGANVESVIEAALAVARDGTKRALDAVLPLVSPTMTRETFILSVRRAYLPYSGVVASAQAEPDVDLQDATISGYGQPSRVMAIENPIVALAAFKWSQGDFMKALTASVFYGQDCESIAAHAAGLCGALGGVAAPPEPLRTASDSMNRRDRRHIATTLSTVATQICAKDALRLTARRQALT